MAPIVTVTERAAQELKAALAQQQNIAGVRLGLAGGGCCGPGYMLALEETGGADDVVVEAGGVKVFVSKDDAPRIQGTKLDFITTPQGAGFHVENPNQVPEAGGHGHGGHGHGGHGGQGHEHGGSGGGCGCGSGSGGCGSGGGGCGSGGCGC